MCPFYSLLLNEKKLYVNYISKKLAGGGKKTLYMYVTKSLNLTNFELLKLSESIFRFIWKNKTKSGYSISWKDGNIPWKATYFEFAAHHPTLEQNTWRVGTTQRNSIKRHCPIYAEYYEKLRWFQGSAALALRKRHLNSDQNALRVADARRQKVKEVKRQH